MIKQEPSTIFFKNKINNEFIFIYDGNLKYEKNDILSISGYTDNFLVKDIYNDTLKYFLETRINFNDRNYSGYNYEKTMDNIEQRLLDHKININDASFLYLIGK